MRATVLQAAGAVLVVTGFAIIAPFAGFLAAGVLLITFGIAIERG
jgi:hypothetical protein